MKHSSMHPVPEVPGYVTLAKIGEGGMGAVYRAQQCDSTRTVAIKFVTPLPGLHDDLRRQRVEREARLVSQLEHPNIVNVLENGTAQGWDFFVMEYVDGVSLRQMLTPGQPMELARARAILDGITQALGYLYEKGIVHRDLKPENVLVDRAGNVKVTDFGLSSAVTEVGMLTATGEVLGTLEYMAPEQRAHLPIDERADQYSLAVITYELLTGKRPHGRFKLPSQINPQLRPCVDTVIVKGLQEDPDDRFGTVRAFEQALRAALSRERRRLPLRAALALTALWTIVLAVAAWNTLRRPTSDAIEARRPDAADANAAAGDTTIDRGEKEREREKSNRKGDLSRSAEVDYFESLAEKHLAAGKHREAEIAFTEALRLAPHEALLFLKRAQLFKKIELHQKALDDLQAAIDLNDKLADAYTGRGTIFVQLKDYEKAIPELDKALRLDPRAADALAYRGWARHSLKHDATAQSDLDQAVVADPNCGVAYQFRALRSHSKGDYRQARSDFTDAVRCMPDDPFAQSDLALLLANCKDLTQRDGKLALHHAQKACELTQWKDWRQLRVLAYAYEQEKNWPAAVKWCESALTMAPDISKKGLKTQLDRYRKLAAAPGGSNP